MNWETTTYNFGTIKKNTTRIITFKANPGLPEIESLSAPCGCTKVKYDSQSRLLTVQYNAGEIPRHLGRSNQAITKYVHVTYKDGTSETLTIKGIKKH